MFLYLLFLHCTRNLCECFQYSLVMGGFMTFEFFYGPLPSRLEMLRYKAHDDARW